MKISMALREDIKISMALREFILKYLFLTTKINYLVLKIFLNIMCKYRQVWYCFEDLVIKKQNGAIGI